jgi:hypothetical protein
VPEHEGRNMATTIEPAYKRSSSVDCPIVLPHYCQHPAAVPLWAAAGNPDAVTARRRSRQLRGSAPPCAPTDGP